MRIFPAILLGLSLITAVNAAEGPKSAGAASQAAQTKPGDVLSPFNADGSKKAPFPVGFIPRLNPIVQRSKDLIDRFDKIVPGIRKDVAAKSARGRLGIAKLLEMQTAAAAAKSDLAAEGVKLEATHQFYDDVIFGGMTLFVGQVEGELTQELKELRAKRK